MNPCLACTAFLVSFVAAMGFSWVAYKTNDLAVAYCAIVCLAAMAVLRGYLPKRGGRS